MAFQQKIYFDGTLLDQKNGSKISIYGQNIISSGWEKDSILYYKRSLDSNWENIAENVDDGANYVLAKSVKVFKNTAIFTRNGNILFRSVYIQDFNNIIPGDLLVLVSIKYDFDSVAGALENFGSSLSFGDNYIAVGADEKNGDENNEGAVYVTGKTGASWHTIDLDNIQTLTADYPEENEYFGCSVEISDDFLIVGARGSDNNKGVVFVFEKNEITNLWGPEPSYKLLASDGEEGDSFGCCLSISGDYMVVGAEFADLSDDEINAGAVYIFKYSASSDRWFEIKKITGVNETDLSGNHFGHSLDLNRDYLIVGSPDARDTGVADVFYKKNDWGHLKKITSSDASSGDSFGESVGIYYPYLVVGSSEYSGGLGDEGRVYVFEDPPVRLRIAQEFDVNKEFLPSKASVYLKPSGDNSFNYWPLYSDRENVIDATNFSTITQGTNKIIFDDRVSSYTGNGYMVLAPEQNLAIIGDSFPVINYPIRSIEDDTYQLWLRCYSNNFGEPSTTNFEVDILLDGEVIRTISEIINEDEWAWLQTDIIIPDTNGHILGIKLKEKGSIIDKIYIDADSASAPEGEGPYNSESPYLTVHMKVYDAYNFASPVDPIFAYDYKTTIDEITQDDWYNFNISVLDDREGYDLKEDFTNNFFLVMSSSGANNNNYVIWEMIDNDEYDSGYSAIKI